MSDTGVTVVESKLAPPQPDRYWWGVYRHRDGRLLEIHRGVTGHNEGEHIKEMFPEGCHGCVGVREYGTFLNGKRQQNYGTIQPEYRINVWNGVCPQCAEREAERLIAIAWANCQSFTSAERFMEIAGRVVSR